MVPVPLFAPESVPRHFLNLSAALVRLVPVLEEPYALFDRSKHCSCSTRDGLAIRGRFLVVRPELHPVNSFPLYALPEDCTLEETAVVVTWLSRHAFKTFRTQWIQKKKSPADNDKSVVMRRSLVGASEIFEKTVLPDKCVRYEFKKDPVFLLKSIAVSPYGTGPTVESVCRRNELSP